MMKKYNNKIYRLKPDKRDSPRIKAENPVMVNVYYIPGSFLGNLGNRIVEMVRSRKILLEGGVINVGY